MIHCISLIHKFTDNPCDLNGYIGVEALLFIQSFPHSHHPLNNNINRYINTRLNNSNLLLFRPLSQTNPNKPNQPSKCTPPLPSSPSSLLRLLPRPLWLPLLLPSLLPVPLPTVLSPVTALAPVPVPALVPALSPPTAPVPLASAVSLVPSPLPLLCKCLSMRLSQSWWI